MGGDALALEAVAGIDEAVAATVDIRVVDLAGIADHDELRALGHAGDDGLGFERGELLRFVEDEEAFWNGTPADVAEGFDLNEALLHEDFVRLADDGGVAVLLG